MTPCCWPSPCCCCTAPPAQAWCALSPEPCAPSEDPAAAAAAALAAAWVCPCTPSPAPCCSALASAASACSVHWVPTSTGRGAGGPPANSLALMAGLAPAKHVGIYRHGEDVMMTVMTMVMMMMMMFVCVSARDPSVDLYNHVHKRMREYELLLRRKQL
eukprot:1159213-Pelagomonas_calceolata.AAC.8